MFLYDKKLQYPVKIDKPNPRLAAVVISQYGGPDGELGASMRYLSQRYATPYRNVAGVLTDIGTEELAHMEMVCAIGLDYQQFIDLYGREKIEDGILYGKDLKDRYSVLWLNFLFCR